MGWKLVIDPLFGVRLADELPLDLLSFPEHFPLSTFRTFDDLVALILCHFHGPPDGHLLSLNCKSPIYPCFVPTGRWTRLGSQARRCHDDASAASFRYTRPIFHDLAEAQNPNLLGLAGQARGLLFSVPGVVLTPRAQENMMKPESQPVFYEAPVPAQGIPARQRSKPTPR